MPCDYKNYPPHWKELRAKVLLRAGNKCECTGECLSESCRKARCNAPNGRVVQRKKTNQAEWAPALFLDAPETPELGKPFKIVLTTAHTCQDASCGDVEHLLALCQRCHLKLDSTQHVLTRKARKKA